jgi:hypothetical protein
VPKVGPYTNRDGMIIHADHMHCYYRDTDVRRHRH